MTEIVGKYKMKVEGKWVEVTRYAYVPPERKKEPVPLGARSKVDVFGEDEDYTDPLEGLTIVEIPDVD
jgi:hypothetical protein